MINLNQFRACNLYIQKMKKQNQIYNHSHLLVQHNNLLNILKMRIKVYKVLIYKTKK